MMSFKRLVAIGGVFILAVVGWGILGTTVFVRSDSFSKVLRGRVERLWGAPVRQAAPRFFSKLHWRREGLESCR